ncbi:hypothetical protein LTS08_001250 [Lithohypha guttulata]|uniref:C2H2-type domain-containing protein n=1 Tax=Lithohypha guttulata TaxID=1690604 RepID=A0AAN7YDH5_9EURO|nr:hypothetical protein LTR05_007805 [Lithohypha guttulata]KAK5104977.1 hypothetical protein LTS08_001250 [Lithohypha guttulata]
MAPRGFTLPSAKTDSAKAARSAFFCELCQKGYSRMNEFDAHESSYDHQHKKRLKDMKDMQRTVQNAGRKEEKGPLMSIKLGGASTKTGGAGGFKKGGFKNAFAPAEGTDEVKKEDMEEDKISLDRKDKDLKTEEDEDSDITDQEDYYDPTKPTGCMPDCPGVAA